MLKITYSIGSFISSSLQTRKLKENITHVVHTILFHLK